MPAQPLASQTQSENPREPSSTLGEGSLIVVARLCDGKESQWAQMPSRGIRKMLRDGAKPLSEAEKKMEAAAIFWKTSALLARLSGESAEEQALRGAWRQALRVARKGWKRTPRKGDEPDFATNRRWSAENEGAAAWAQRVGGAVLISVELPALMEAVMDSRWSLAQWELPLFKPNSPNWGQSLACAGSGSGPIAWGLAALGCASGAPWKKLPKAPIEAARDLSPVEAAAAEFPQVWAQRESELLREILQSDGQRTAPAAKRQSPRL